MSHISEVIIRPLLTEKSSNMTEESNRYSFQVQRWATKRDIREALEKYFNVKVDRISTMVVPGKLRRSGRGVKRTTNWKKAYVQIAEGQKIELFKSV